MQISSVQTPRVRQAGRVLLSLALVCLSAGAMAQGPSGGGNGGPPAGAPAEALTACKTAKSGDACSFTGQRGAVSGTCQAPEGRPLACRPKGAPSGN